MIIKIKSSQNKKAVGIGILHKKQIVMTIEENGKLSSFAVLSIDEARDIADAIYRSLEGYKI